MHLSCASQIHSMMGSFQVLFREDATVDDLIDVIEGNRKYMKCVYVYNKIDVIGIDDVDKLARQPHSVVISCNLKASSGAFIFYYHMEDIVIVILMMSSDLSTFFWTIKQLNLDRLLAKMWEEMGLVRVYTKPQGQQPDFTDPVVLSVVCCILFSDYRFKLQIFAPPKFSLSLSPSLSVFLFLIDFFPLGFVLIGQGWLHS